MECLTEINAKSQKEKLEKNPTMNQILNASANEFASNQRSQCVAHNKRFDHLVFGLDNGFITIRKSIKNLKLKFREDIKVSNKAILSLKFSPNYNYLALLSEDERIIFLKVDNNYSLAYEYTDLESIPLEFDWDTTSTYVQVINSTSEYFIYRFDKGKINGTAFKK